MKQLPLLLVCGCLVSPISALAAERGLRGGGNTSFSDLAARSLAESRFALAFLGVKVEELDQAGREKMNVPAGLGLRITYLQPGSPAAGALLRRDDVLVRLNRQWLATGEQLRTFVQACRPGEPVDLTVWRARHEFVVRVRLASWSDPTTRGEGGDPAGPYSSRGGAGGPPGDPAAGARRGQLEQAGGAAFPPLAGTPLPGPGGEVARNLPDFEGRDDLHYEISAGAGPRRVVVRDPSGMEVFTGAIETEAERLALPPGVLSAVEVIESSPGLSEPEIFRRVRARPRWHYPRTESTREVNETLRARTDDGGTVEVLVHGRHRELIVRDAEEKITFEGPINTEVERRLAPEDALAIADELVSGHGRAMREQAAAELDEALI